MQRRDVLPNRPIQAFHGASDRIGAYPASDPARPEDLSATMLHLLGISPETEVRDALDRPLPASPGKPIEGVLA